MLARALHSPVHRLAGEPGVPELGVSLQLQRRLQQGPVPELPQEPLQQTRLRRQQDPPRQERQDVPEDRDMMPFKGEPNHPENALQIYI